MLWKTYHLKSTYSHDKDSNVEDVWRFWIIKPTLILKKSLYGNIVFEIDVLQE